MAFNFNRINLAMIIGGGVLGFLGFQELRLYLKSKPEPTEMTLAELAENGPGDNLHVTITDFGSSLPDIVAEGKPDGAGGYKDITKAWIPCVPGESEAIAPNVRLYLICKGAASMEAVAMQTVEAMTTGATGLIVNDVMSPSTKVKEALASEGFAGLDFERMYYLEMGRSQPGMGKLGLMLGGGTVLALGGLWWMFLYSPDAPGKEQNATFGETP